MASSYVFRKIDGELWRQARARALSLNLRFLDVVQSLLRDWLTANAGMDERYWIHFEETTSAGHTSWDVDCSTLEEAEEMAENEVDQGEADRATVTARYADIHREYTKRGGWDHSSDEPETEVIADDK